MLSLFVWAFIFLTELTSEIYARLPDARLHGNMMRPANIPLVDAPSDIPVTSRNGTELPPYSTVYYFDQLIDHNRPSLGTFKQRFWHTCEFYEKGGPIILMTPGEVNADSYYGYLTNRTINGLITQQQNGSTIVLEHRFYGLSNPYPDLSVKSLRVHTIQQAIDDLEYFARNVNLPMPGGDAVTPDKTPWVLVGGSYAGALTSWTMVNKPSLFAAGYASSAVVQATLNFWAYFEPIRQNMPANCSADVQAVIAFVDKTFSGRNTTAIQALKDNWGLGNLSHVDDVAGALRNNLWDWQSLQVTSGAGSQFYRFCDALEYRNGIKAPIRGWGVDYALSAWGKYWRNIYLSGLCRGNDVETCLGTYDPTLLYWTDITIDNPSRSWMWIVCNEVGYLQDTAPSLHPTLVSRLIQPSYDMRQCQQMFPQAFTRPPIPNTALTNAKYQGWDVKIKNLFFANGVRDPWRAATVSAQGLNLPSTAHQPIGLADGFHCSDLGVAATIDPSIAAVQTQALASMRRWLADWRPQNNTGPVRTPRSKPAPPTKGSEHGIWKPVNAWFVKADVMF
ncbi:hypothetical protein BDN70DRAFT_856398 [Pholiota conissans]|uniref:Peptidase S28 n=1 Tax=Pholiota conissans TaxID=109636 RepID=A0A9P6CVF4_9AGAR|nr:hypothetical protein BDN70DRAFT_856398 [Pholiota conissans]